MWVDAPVKTPAWRRRHSRRVCFPGQGRGGPPRGAAGTPWRLGRSSHPTRLAPQQCTQMAQNGAERPFSPICVHSCVFAPAHNGATVYTNGPKRLRGVIFANLCTLFCTPRPLALAPPRPLSRPGGATGPTTSTTPWPRDARALGPDTHVARAVTQSLTHTSSRSLFLSRSNSREAG